MDQGEENKYVSQLQEVFNSCDTTGTGYLDKDELTDLCHKLHLDTQLPLLLQTVLGNDQLARVNFEEFKEGFVAVLSSTIDISISDDDESSYLEPVVPEEVQPKFVKGNKRYGRRTHPEREGAENENKKYLHDKDHWKSQLRRSSSLESVESLKSDEEAEIAKEPQTENFEAQGQLRTWNPGFFDSPRRISSAHDMTENQVRDIWEELGVGNNGYLNRQELATVCKNIGLEDLCEEELEDLFKKLDRDGDGLVSFQEFQVGLFSHAPLPVASTPLKKRHAFFQVEENSHNTASQSLLSGYGGFHLFSSIDDGTGFGNPEQIMTIWEEEGIQNSKDILMSLDFNVEGHVNLLDLTTALDNELIATKNRLYLAALASYKHELHHQYSQIEQVSKERNKVKQDLERAEKRNLQLADEVDDHNSVMESLNESKIKDLEQEYKQRLSVIRTELETEKDLFLQQSEQQKKKLETDLANFQMEEAYLREKLNLSIKENSRLQKEMVEIVGKLSESEEQVVKLQTSIDNILKEKKLTDPHGSELFSQEEKFAEIIRQYEIQCRELRDRNDELQIQLETLRSQLSESRYSRLLAKMKDNKLLHHKAKDKIDDGHKTTKKGISLKPRRSASAVGSCVLPASTMTMEAELTKHQVKELQQEIQDLKIQLETKVNYYERELELMKTNFEKERKDTEQNFKLEISEVEEQKADLEELNAKYQEVIDSLREQLPKSGHIQEMEKKFEKERAEMEEYYAKEISALAQRLTNEKEQLEEDLKRTHRHELHSVREATEDEVIEKLAQIEAKYTHHSQYLMQQHLNEKDELVRKHDMEKNVLIQDHIREINQWAEREKTLMAQWKKDQLRLVEQQNEDQVGICKSFAIEKERIETHYRDHIHGLNQEIEGLNALLIKAKNSCVITRKQQQPVEKRHGNPGMEGTVADLNQQVLSLLSVDDKADAGQLICDIHHLQENTPLMHGMDEEPSRDTVIERHKRYINSPSAQNKQVSFSVDVAEGQSAKKSEESTLIKLQEMEGMVTSPRAQPQEQTKAQQTLKKEQGRFEGEKEHLSSLLESRADKCLLSEDKDLISQLQESREHVQKLESMLEFHGRERGVVLAGNVEKDHRLNLMRGETVMMAAHQDLAGDGMLEKVYQPMSGEVTLEDLAAKNVMLQQQLRSNEDEMNVLQRQIEETMSKCQVMEEWATKQVQDAREELESEKDHVKNRLLELEDLVRRLEQQTSACQDDSIQIETLIKETDKAYGKLEDVNKQNQDYQEELSRLNTQHQEAIHKMNIKLEEMNEQKDEANSALVRLQEAINGLEEEKFQQELSWQKEREHLEHELQISKQETDKTQNEIFQLNCTVSSLKAQNDAHQEALQKLEGRLGEMTQQKEGLTATIEKLQDQLSSVEKEKVQQEANWQQIRVRLEYDLQISKNQIENLMFKHKQEKQDLLNGLDKTNKQLLVMANLQEEISSLKQVKESLEDQCQSVSKLLKETTEQVSQIEELKCELKQAQEECQMWKESYDQLKAELDESHDELLDANSTLTLVQSQHMREVQQLKEKLCSAVPMEQIAELQNRLLEEQQKVQQLQERMRFHAEQTNYQLAMQQEEHEKLLRRIEERMQDVEMNLKNVREMLQEKVDQLNEQLEKNAKSDLLLKDLYVENSQLMKALQVTEQRQKSAEKKNYYLEEKIAALNKVMKKIAPASLAV
ncbi:ninein-like protein isoform X2 [Hyla sarda]|uniref:ninein-like protein isoform X2 n=1 Tax=Hyla sarda TaxID=327740 RepID=UPI0024C309EB|nr:ninein-like protein isoform X2 [Hyla sarda]